ncbi:hypothetical protein CVU82_00435 [Candidatus Falkowbacteria bacterium HGW-Falkowbacteria-1]|jgi:hypothetical protein|uniref:Uncharacterized protein n=1 Tax=Candidatus Falkowbacteria bacterium HGW-Falkowbacteria-1 TaxID=2013768 RepID=A0A2N2EAB6_9BACT|nr:MAG: hypothetical protein CVU82_00435 [Candidatus Falkowbacteria bacterium HGW-Falkowbacteria-1]
MKKIILLLVIFVAIGIHAKSQNIVRVQDYMESKCFENVDSIFISISSKELKKKDLQEIVILKTVDSLKVLTLRKIRENKIKEAKNAIWAMRCLMIEKEKIIVSKKKRKTFFNNYLETKFYCANYILKQESVSSEEYHFIFWLQVTGVSEIDNLAAARDMAIRYISSYKKTQPQNWNFGISVGDDKKRECLENGMEMLITAYERGLNKSFGVNDFEKAMEIMLSYIPPEIRKPYVKQWKTKIGDRAKIYLQ